MGASRPLSSRAALVIYPLALASLNGCCIFSRSAPASQFPSADDAIERMRATQSCNRGVTAEAKVDYFGDQGRVRGNLLYLTSVPDKLRFDVFSPFGVVLSTLTSDGKDFTLFDIREKSFIYGPANACNVGRFTGVPVPPFALVSMLRGEAPVLVHEKQQASIAWECGEYVVRIESKHQALQEIHLEPHDDDFSKPWNQQSVRVLSVRVEQEGIDLYEATLADHRRQSTSKPRVSQEDFVPELPPSGPACQAELPMRIRLEVPGTDEDLIVINKEISHNPPLLADSFTQKPPGGVRVRYSSCRP